MSEISNILQDATTSLSGEINVGTNKGAATLEFPLNLENLNRPIVRFVCINHDNTVPIEQICLPCPGNVVFTDSATYATIDMGAIAGAAEAISAFGKSEGSIIEKTGAAIKDVGAQVGSGGGMGAAILLTNKLGMESTSNALGFAAKQVINPRTNTTFSGNTLRNFQFDFKMIGANEQEVRMIDTIQNVFRYNTYASELGGRKTLLQYPPLWHIEFLNPNTMAELEYMPKIFSCYLTTAACTINAENNTYRKDFSPHEVSVSISFQESKVLTRQEIEDLELNSNRENADTAFFQQKADELVKTQEETIKRIEEEAAVEAAAAEAEQ